ncbi:peroxiredoxin [candidate division KSB1 bacterium]|nr:peroxiredoxin [candidate division KSB1 bacterium]
MSDTTATAYLPRLNEPAPDFTAKTTQGELKLADFKGRKWVVLFSHPADFTPVCTTEFIAFARNHEKFERLNTQIIGLSIDSIYSHIAWVRNIEDKFDVKVPFPVIADLKMDVARAYGMVHPTASDTSAVRAVFVIDDKGIIRAMIYYPLTNGRSIDEVLRIVEALQTTDKNQVATPENWRAGDKCIVLAPQTVQVAAQRSAEGFDYTDWYFTKKAVNS